MPAPALTPREAEVLRGLAAGLSQKEIGAQMGISPGRVQQLVAAIREKQRADTTAEAIARSYGTRRGS